MTIRDLFRILIKMIGLYFIYLFIFGFLPSNIPYLLYGSDTISLLLFMLTLIILVLLFMLLIFKPDKIIDLFKLDRGFDNNSIGKMEFSTSNIIKLACFIVGGILFIENIPSLLSQIYLAFKITSGGTDNYFELTKNDYILLGTTFFKVIIGLLLIAGYDFVSKLFKVKEEERK